MRRKSSPNQSSAVMYALPLRPAIWRWAVCEQPQLSRWWHIFNISTRNNFTNSQTTSKLPLKLYVGRIILSAYLLVLPMEFKFSLSFTVSLFSYFTTKANLFKLIYVMIKSKFISIENHCLQVASKLNKSCYLLRNLKHVLTKA